jgi:3-hydroxyisobutyrate dehydrogenase
MSTVGVQAARALAREAGACGLDLLDAPVSGGVQGAANGRLTVMLGGPEHVRARAQFVLDVLAAEIVVAGDEAGDGQGVKLVNQQVMCVNILGLVEGLRLASALGLEHDAVLAVLGTGTGRNWAVDHWPEVRAFWERYGPQGSLELLRKDLALLLEEAAGAGLELPVSAATAGLLRDAWPGG